MVMRTLERYLAVPGCTLGWYVDEESESRPLDDRAWARTRMRLMDGSHARADLWDADVLSGGHGFYYRGNRPGQDPSLAELCTMYVSFPTEYLEEHGPQHMTRLVIELSGELPIRSGNFGLALDQAWSDEALQKVKEYYFRYPGISLVSHLGSRPELGRGVNDISWLTFLGHSVLGELGGAAGLRARLHSPGTTVTELDGDRVMVRLGDWPEAGDLQQGQDLPAYRELARVLEPWLLRANPDWYRQLFSPEELRRWERRFLD